MPTKTELTRLVEEKLGELTDVTEVIEVAITRSAHSEGVAIGVRHDPHNLGANWATWAWKLHDDVQIDFFWGHYGLGPTAARMDFDARVKRGY